MNLEELKAKLRRQIGNPSTDQYPDDNAEDDVVSGINEYSKCKPDKVLDSFDTERNTPVYDLSDKERIMNVIEVYWDTCLEWEFDKYWPMSIDIGRLAGISLFENPSIWVQYTMRLKQYKGVFDRTFEYNKTSKTLRLIPEPATSDSKVFFIWTRRHEADTVPEEDIDDMLLWAKGMAYEAMASPKASQVKSVSGYGQSVTMEVNTLEFIKRSEDLKKQFRERFGGGTLISIG